MLCGVQGGLYRFDPASGSFLLIEKVEENLPHNRLNDATVDPSGRLWFGTMHDGCTDATGGIYHRTAGQTDAAAIDPVIVTNGPAISPDGNILYHVDTFGRAIFARTLGQGGELGPPSLFARIEEGAGYPDGPAIDAEGHLWIGLFGGWGVRRYSPSGRLVETVDFPVANVTKMAFVDGQTTAYATTAREGLSDDELARQPLAGNLFAFDAGVVGSKTHLIAT